MDFEPIYCVSTMCVFFVSSRFAECLFFRLFFSPVPHRLHGRLLRPCGSSSEFHSFIYSFTFVFVAPQNDDDDVRRNSSAVCCDLCRAEVYFGGGAWAEGRRSAR